MTAKELFQTISPAEFCRHPAMRGDEKTEGRQRIRFHIAVRAYRVIVDHLLQALCKLREAGLREKKYKERVTAQHKGLFLKQGFTNNKNRLNANFIHTVHGRAKLFRKTGVTDLD